MKYFYALYKGDNFIDLGSKKYLANQLNVKVGTIQFYMSPTYRNRGLKDLGDRYIVIKLKEVTL